MNLTWYQSYRNFVGEIRYHKDFTTTNYFTLVKFLFYNEGFVAKVDMVI